MDALLALLTCFVFAVFLQSLKHAYFSLPKAELKRRINPSEPVYRRLETVARYDFTARVFLSTPVFIFGAMAVIIASRSFDPFIVLAVLAVLFAVFKFFSSFHSALIDKAAAFLAPYLARLLYYLHPIVDLLKDIIPRKKTRPATDIYEVEDLQKFIKKQQRASNNRIPHPELTAVLNSLEFGGKKIKDFMVKRSHVHFVNSKDTVGPILLSELHKSGQTAFPVQGNSEDEVAGILYLHDLAKHTEGGTVGDYMEEKVMYLRQDKPLEDVLQGFSKTGRHEFVVLDEAAKITGLITLKEVLEEMIGHSVRSDFDDYDNPSAVASE